MEDASKRFAAVNLSFNLGAATGLDVDPLLECNPGGSVICNPGTGGCGAAAMTCVGASCSGSSATKDLLLDAHILVEREQLEALSLQIREIVGKFVR